MKLASVLEKKQFLSSSVDSVPFPGLDEPHIMAWQLPI